MGTDGALWFFAVASIMVAVAAFMTRSLARLDEQPDLTPSSPVAVT
jgi:hypothetical protein